MWIRDIKLFISFANFYIHFIKDFRNNASQFTLMLKKNKSFKKEINICSEKLNKIKKTNSFKIW